MTAVYIKGGDVILKDRVLKGAAVAIKAGRIAGVGRHLKAKKGALTIDAGHCFVSPGFIDTHIHGSPSDVFLNEIRGGTTSVVIAISCDKPSTLAGKIKEIEKFRKESFLGPNLLGARLEGPYINKVRCGAQNELFINRPSRQQLLKILKMCGGLLKVMTIAPELKGALPLIKILKSKNIIASIGHSDASYEDAIKGADAGITHSTHIFNGMRGIDRREPGAAGAALLDGRITPEVILDMTHVHRAIFELLFRIKGPDRMILITDSVRAQPPKKAKKSGCVYVFKDGTITGSSISMIDVLKNAVKQCGARIEDAVRMMSLTPARAFGASARKGSIENGKDADIVIFNKNFDVKTVLIRGRIAFRSSI